MTTRWLVVATIGLLPGIAAAQGLGEAAREAAQRRERERTTGREPNTYTDADLTSEREEGDGAEADASDRGSGGRDAPPTTVDGASARSSTASVAGSDRDEPDRLREELDRAAARRKEQEQKWRERAAAARARLDAARKEHDAVCRTGGFSVPGG